MSAKLYYLQDARQFVGNCVLWWRLGGGYTTEIKDAELFPAEKLRGLRDTDVPWAQEIVMSAICQHVRIEHLQEAARTAPDAEARKPRPRKRTRSQQRYDRYRAIRDVCPDLKFREFLKQEREFYP